MRRAASAISARLGLVLLVAVVLHLPALVAFELLGPDSALAVGSLLSFFAGPLVAAALTEHTVLTLGGDRAAFGEALRRALRHALVALPLALLIVAIESFGYALLFVPGIVASILLSLAMPVRIVEGASIGASLSRSVALTRGARWALALAMLTASSLAGLLYRLAFLLYGEAGALTAIMLQSVLLGAVSVVVYVDRRQAHEGVEIDVLVRRLGGTPGGAARALDAEVERALARAATAPPVALDSQAAPRSVKDHELLEAATGRDARMRTLKIAFAVVAAATFVGLGITGVVSRANAKHASAEKTARLLADLERARASSFAVREAIVMRPDLYGKDVASLVAGLAESNDKERTMIVLSSLDAELSAMGCADAVAPSKRSRSGAELARLCPASLVTPDDARGVPAYALATATVLETRAAQRARADDPVHKALVAALLRR